MRLWGWVMAVVVLSTAGMIAGCSRDRLSANSTGNSNSNVTTNARTTTAPPPQDNVRRVTIAELREMLEQGKAVVIDVRGDAMYNTEHIKGALNINEAQLNARAVELPKDKLIVLYCS
jgi:3-mercaptopyruvate sulfurtransferase SseA